MKIMTAKHKLCWQKYTIMLQRLTTAKRDWFISPNILV